MVKPTICFKGIKSEKFEGKLEKIEHKKAQCLANVVEPSEISFLVAHSLNFRGLKWQLMTVIDEIP